MSEQFMKDAFNMLPLVQGWDTWCDEHSQGYAVDYPMKLKRVIKVSLKTSASEQVSIEFITMDFLKDICQ